MFKRSKSLDHFSQNFFSAQNIFGAHIFFEFKFYWSPKVLEPKCFNQKLFQCPKYFQRPNIFSNSNLIYQKKFSNPNFLGIKIYLDPDNFLHLYFFSPKMSSGPIVLDQTFYWSKDISIKFSNPIHFKTELK